jgi:hypothetical protein
MFASLLLMGCTDQIARIGNLYPTAKDTNEKIA